MNQSHKLIAGTAAIALLAGVGATYATMKLISSSSPSSPSQPRAHTGIGGFGLGGGRLGGRGFGGGLGGGGGYPRHGVGFGSFAAGALAPLTSYLGLSSSALQAELGKGQTLAQIAVAQGKSVNGLVAALLAARKAELAQQVAAGRLTTAEEQQLEATAAQRIRDLVNGAPPPRLPGQREDRIGTPGSPTA